METQNTKKKIFMIIFLAVIILVFFMLEIMAFSAKKIEKLNQQERLSKSEYTKEKGWHEYKSNDFSFVISKGKIEIISKENTGETEDE